MQMPQMPNPPTPVLHPLAPLKPRKPPATLELNCHTLSPDTHVGLTPGHHRPCTPMGPGRFKTRPGAATCGHHLHACTTLNASGRHGSLDSSATKGPEESPLKARSCHIGFSKIRAAGPGRPPGTETRRHPAREADKELGLRDLGPTQVVIEIIARSGRHHDLSRT